jgi:hypothetical protein
MVVFMYGNSAYDNGRIKNWYGFTARRHNSLLNFYIDPAIPGDFIELKIKYLLEGARRAEESLRGLAGFYADIEKRCGKIMEYRARLGGKHAEKLLLLILISIALPKLAVSQPLLNGICSKISLLYQSLN